MGKADLVTGAFGFSGSHLVKQLLEQGRTVIGTDTAGRLKNKQRIKECYSIGLDLQHPNLQLIAADLTDMSSLKELFHKTPEIEMVFNTASLYSYSASLSTLKKINVVGTENLLATLPQDITHFIHWSTCGVFGKPIQKGALSGIPFSEQSESPKNMSIHSRRPASTPLVNEYSVSKWEQEQLLWKVHREDGLPLTVIRPAPIYGPGSRYGHGGIVIAIATGLLPFIPSASKRSKTISVHVEDLGRFALHVAGKKEYFGQDFNVVDSSDISYYEFIHYIAGLLDKKIMDVPYLPMGLMKALTYSVAKVVNVLNLKKRFPQLNVVETQSAKYIGSSYRVDNSKSRSIGFSYNYPDVKNGIKDTIDWFKRQGWIS
jgi:nucleoside-diphosphate-sugar epimerase